MNFAADPILGGQQGTFSQEQLASLGEDYKRLCALQQQRASINMQPQQSKTPTWDEIDKIMDGLTEAQKSFLNKNQEFVDSYQEVAGILQREELRMIRPIVEQTKDGKEALEKHLALIKKLRKEAMQAEERKSALWEDYITNHSEMTWKDYIAMRNKKGDVK